MKEILRQLREEHFFSQGTVAKEVGISRQSYIKYEAGEVEPSVEIIRKLSKLYQVPYETIIDNKVHLINEYVIKDYKLEVADSGATGYSSSRARDISQVMPVYFCTSEMNYLSKKAAKFKLSIEQFLYKAALKYEPEAAMTNYFEDFVPLGTNTGEILKDYHNDDIFGEMTDERYHF